MPTLSPHRPAETIHSRPHSHVLSESERFVITRISTLNVLLKRRAALYARRTFGFTFTEWRIVTLLRTLPPISIRALAVEALSDPAQISRAAASLASVGYLTRKRSADDSREILLVLTKRGLKLSQEMWQSSLGRNDELIENCGTEEVRELVETLDRLINRATAMVAMDESQARPSDQKTKEADASVRPSSTGELRSRRNSSAGRPPRK